MQIEPFLDFLKLEKRYSHNTIISYRNDLLQFEIFLNNNYQAVPCSGINHKQIRHWLSELINDNKTAKTVNRKITTLKTYFHYLLIKNIITQNPMEKVTGPKNSKDLPVFVSKESLDNLLDIIEFSPDFKGIRGKLILELFYYTGMRLSELIELKHSDFDWFNMTVKVTGKRNKQRIIPLLSSIKKLYDVYIKHKNYFCKENNIVQNEYVFITNKGEKMYAKLVYRIVNTYLTKVSTVTKKSPHVLRHSFATHMLDQGADLNAIKEILGHANLSATQVYTHNTIEKLKTVYKQAHPKA